MTDSTTTTAPKTRRSKEQAPADAPADQEEVEPEAPMSNWTFVDVTPTTAEVAALLNSLPEVWGVAPVDFADFVQALPQTTKRDPDKPKGPANQKTTYTLYFSVAGRQAMCNAAQLVNGWTVECVPEKKTTTGIPGVLSMEDAIVYREYLRITDREGRLLGSKPGMAWVPGLEDRRNAAQSNPFEKVETAARGRSLAAWGFGVLPGSGVASLEEMQNAAQIQRQQEYRQQRQANGGGQQAGLGLPADVTKETLVPAIRTASTAIQQRRQRSDAEQDEKLVKFLERAGSQNFYNPSTFEVDWAKVADIHKVMLLNELRKQVAILDSQEAAV